MENNLETIIKLAGVYGFIEVLPRNNPVMISFKEEEDPMYPINVYFTTMTVTVQSLMSKWSKLSENIKDCSMDKLEDVFILYGKNEII